MSSVEVRTAVRELVTGVGWPAELPYRETVEKIPDEGRPTPGVLEAWCTVGFEADSDSAIGIGPGAPLREVGRVSLRVYATGGLGDATVGALAADAADAIRAHSWGASGVYVLSISPPQAVDDVDDAWAILELTVNYERDHAP